MTSTRFHIICERDVGLFSLVQQVIANVAWAIEEDRIPIVYFGRRNCYWTANGYRGRDTVWEYYFEPVFPDFPVSRIAPQIHERIAMRPPSDREAGYALDDNIFVSSNFGKHSGFGGGRLTIPYEFDDPGDALRQRASEIIRKYIRPRPEIVEQADQFFREHLQGRYVIGVQIRGTDALVEEKRARLGHRLDFSRYVAVINELLRLHPDAAIFVASDAESSVAKMREMFGDRVVATDAVRHREGDLAGRGPTGAIMPAYLTADTDKAARGGEDAVIDYLLLSRCDHLVHNGSSLARTVMLHAPGMAVSSTVPKPTYFDRIAYRWWFWSRRGFPLPVPERLDTALRSVWRRASPRGDRREAADSIVPRQR